MDLKQDIFIIPSKNKKCIIYAPLRKALFFASENAVIIVQKYIKEEPISDEEKKTKVYEYLEKIKDVQPVIPRENNIDFDSKLIIVTSQLCNLACYYCYAAETRSNEILSKDKLKLAIDYMLANPDSLSKKFTFIGGGEPTLTWDLLEWAIVYINNSKKENQTVQFSITTNGTLLSDERISFLRKHNVFVGLSFEILSEIQNTQRKHTNQELKSFDIVNSAIKKLMENDIDFVIRSTITNNNVHLMRDMVNFVSENYAKVKEIRFEQVHGTQDSNSCFYDAFIENFFMAKEFGKEKGIKVTNSVSTALSQMKVKFCRGEFCVTPTGDLVSCHRVSSNKDDLFEYYNYGYIDNQVIIEEEKMKKVAYYAKSRMEECNVCFAKWHCAGDCSVERLTLSEEQRPQKCDFIRKIILKLLEEQLAG
jgi:radical SAM protein with 4Fe4S-binding SPASM domain